MRLYRFNLSSKKNLLRAVRHVATRSSRLVEKIIGRELPIHYLSIFAHRPAEYERIAAWIAEMGKAEAVEDGLKVTLKEPIRTRAGDLKRLRVRRPDPYRSQVGCADFDVGDYTDFRDKVLEKYPGNVRRIQYQGYETLEFHDPDVDVLAYVFSISGRPLR